MNEEGKYRVIRDTREKEGKGWHFGPTEKCSGTTIETMRTGDYTLKGYEDYLCIERKGSVVEVAGNLIQPRFYEELERLEEFQFPFLVLEFNMDDLIRYPFGCGLPAHVRRKCKMDGFVLLGKLNEMMLKYKTKVLFVGEKGKDVASSLFKRVVENYEPNIK